MRRIVALVLVSLMPAVPAAAQFEGTVHMKMSGSGSAAAEGMAIRIAIKGDRQATIMAMPPSAGPMAGMEMRSIIDGKANTVTTLMPMPPGMPAMPGMADAKGFKTVTDLTKMSVGAQSDSKVEIKKLGTTQRIAGFDCDDYEITSGNGSTTRSCITQSLGRFILPEAGGGESGNIICHSHNRQRARHISPSAHPGRDCYGASSNDDKCDLCDPVEESFPFRFSRPIV
jgi:hypothetical protein